MSSPRVRCEQGKGVPVIELLRSNDPVLISFAESLLIDADLTHSVADSHMSVMEGSIGALPRRILVADEQLTQARRLLTDAGVAVAN